MSGTHQQLLYHIVFSTKQRKRLLTDKWREEVLHYLSGTTKNLQGFPLEVGGWVDHVHLLVRIPAKFAVSDFVRQLKASTSKHINDTSGKIRKFGWQDGFGAFTVSVSQKAKVAKYVREQVQHHQQENFQEEYLRLLKLHDIEYDERYVWD